MKHRVLIGFACGFAALAGGTAASIAQAAYDGTWQVTIITERGNCDRAYSYPLAVKSGDVRYAGQADFRITGKVQANGAVAVRVSRGADSADASGRLSGKTGSGTWKSPMQGGCGGRWEADKRS